MTRNSEEVEEIVRATLLALGIDVDDPKENRHIKADFLYLRKQRLGSEEIARIAKKSAITVAIGGLLWTLLQGFKIALTMKGFSP